MLRLSSLKQGAVYTLEKTWSFKSSTRESRKQVEVREKKTRKIEFTDKKMESNQEKIALIF